MQLGTLSHRKRHENKERHRDDAFFDTAKVVSKHSSFFI